MEWYWWVVLVGVFVAAFVWLRVSYTEGFGPVSKAPPKMSPTTSRAPHELKLTTTPIEALSELVFAVQDAQRRYSAGDARAILSTMLSSSMKQALAVLMDKPVPSEGDRALGELLYDLDRIEHEAIAILDQLDHGRPDRDALDEFTRDVCDFVATTRRRLDTRATSRSARPESV